MDENALVHLHIGFVYTLHFFFFLGGVGGGGGCSKTLGLNLLKLHFVILANHDQNV